MLTFFYSMKQTGFLGYRMEAPKGTPDDCYTLMLKCWEFSPENRFNFKKIEEELERIYKEY